MAYNVMWDISVWVPWNSCCHWELNRKWLYFSVSGGKVTYVNPQLQVASFWLAEVCTVHREGRNKNTESKHESELSVTTYRTKVKLLCETVDRRKHGKQRQVLWEGKKRTFGKWFQALGQNVEVVGFFFSFSFKLVWGYSVLRKRLSCGVIDINPAYGFPQ